MKPLLQPERVFVTADVESDAVSRARADRMIAAMTPGHVERGLTDRRLNQVIAERGWGPRQLWGERDQPRDPDVVFTCFHADASEEQRRARLSEFPNLNVSGLAADHALRYRVDGEPGWREAQHRVCQPAWELHSVTGCPFRCQYCWFGNVLNVRVNIEEILEATAAKLTTSPPQTLWKWDNQTDLNCFEPEYDAVRPAVEFFAKQREHYLLLYTGKSDNVDFMLDYDHGGKTIIQWSVSPLTQSTVFEPLTAPWDARIEAARKCEQAGYPVRFRLSPIMPVRNWRQEYTDLIELMFARTRPDVIALCMFGWMDFSETEKCLDLDLWAADFVEAMRGAAPFLKGKRYGPLPHEARAAIYRHLIDEITRVSPRTPIALCLETPEMWRLFRDELQQDEDDYVCVCGPHCTPGNPLFDVRDSVECH